MAVFSSDFAFVSLLKKTNCFIVVSVKRRNEKISSVFGLASTPPGVTVKQRRLDSGYTLMLTILLVPCYFRSPYKKHDSYYF